MGSLALILAPLTALGGLKAAPRQFASQVDVVEIYASVTDANGNPVTGLSRGDFEVAEDGVPQEISTFAAGEFPLSAAVAIDRSWSMNERRLQAARSAARLFLGALRPADEVMVIAVGSEVETIAPLSRDRQQQHQAIAAVDRWGTTSLHDAVIAAIDAIQPASGRRALVILSDGDDRYSRATAADALARARAADVLIYPIALGERRPPLFAELATLTGGRSAHLEDARLLPETLTAIARELRHQYLIGYAPKRPLENAGEWRSIEVRVLRADVRVRARDGYLVSGSARRF
jgi:Ca-activated chloride channel family protein